jgi:mannitol/fructose-specific phosphotransferase system IIA component (Ntr-type)
MRLTEILGPTQVLLPLDAADKWQAIEQLLAHLREGGHLTAADERSHLESILARERSMSTGMEQGIAIPHAAVDGLDKILGCLGVVSRPEGLPFDCLDQQPAFLVVLLLIPRAQKLAHIRTLGEIARLLSRRELRERLIAAQDAAQVHALLVEAEQS